MGTSDFARRHGFSGERPVFKKRDYLPEDVRERAGKMMVDHLERFAAEVRGRERAYKDGPWLFVQVVRDSLPRTRELWNWYEAARKSIDRYSRVTNRHTDRAMRHQLLRPLKDCEWAWFYDIVENACTTWQRKGPRRGASFAAELNLLLESHGVPWILQSGLVIPADEYEFADELRYLERVSVADDVSDPRVQLKKAFVALFRKQGGPDITGACLHAWSAWETAREVAGGIERVKRSYPELWEAITAWQKLIHVGRHPGKNQDRLPTEGEARFIVGLLTNAVRLVSPSEVTDDTS